VPSPVPALTIATASGPARRQAADGAHHLPLALADQRDVDLGSLLDVLLPPTPAGGTAPSSPAADSAHGWA
jgi:hypothetical protein